MHAQDKARDARRGSTELGVPCPAARASSADAAEASPAFGLPVRPEDHARRVRRQGRLVRLLGRGVRRAVRGRGRGRRPDPRRGARRLPPRAVRARGARRPSGQAAAYPVVESIQRDGICREVVAPAPGPRPRPGRRRRRRSRCGSPASSTSPASSPSSCSRPPTGGCWSTSWRCGRTTPATGPRTAPSPRSSRTTCAPCSTCRSARPRRGRRWTVMVNILGGARRHRPACTTATRTRWPATRACGCTSTARTLRPGRKVGHVNAYGDDLDDCLERARHAAAWFARRPGRRE